VALLATSGFSGGPARAAAARAACLVWAGARVCG